jgi:cellulose synthase/poly-beta-1,6-N-acetylglucosamine synthase-like glycosyltransferase
VPELIFWTCGVAILWTFAGYPATMLIRSARMPRRMRRRGRGTTSPSVSVVVAVRNAADLIEARVANLLSQDYPWICEILVVSNGSSDDTVGVAQRLASADSRVRVLTSPASEGKAGAINTGAATATGDVLVFADARQRFDSRAVRRLARAFSDPSVGAVTGRLVIAASASAAATGVRGYWQFETLLRIAEGRTGSVVGATGAIYAVRRDRFVPLPPAVILDDVYLPMAVVLRGDRVVMAPAAVAFDVPSKDLRAEHRRRVRTLVGNIEMLRVMPDLLSPTRNPIFVRFVSHKLLRLLTPLLSLGLVVSGLAAAGTVYRLAAAALLAVYALGALGFLVPGRALAFPAAFLMLHTAGLAALFRPRRSASDVWAA